MAIMITSDVARQATRARGLSIVFSAINLINVTIIIRTHKAEQILGDTRNFPGKVVDLIMQLDLFANECSVMCICMV